MCLSIRTNWLAPFKSISGISLGVTKDPALSSASPKYAWPAQLAEARTWEPGRGGWRSVSFWSCLGSPIPYSSPIYRPTFWPQQSRVKFTHTHTNLYLFLNINKDFKAWGCKMGLLMKMALSGSPTPISLRCTSGREQRSSEKERFGASVEARVDPAQQKLGSKEKGSMDGEEKSKLYSPPTPGVRTREGGRKKTGQPLGFVKCQWPRKPSGCSDGGWRCREPSRSPSWARAFLV